MCDDCRHNDHGYCTHTTPWYQTDTNNTCPLWAAKEEINHGQDTKDLPS